MKILILTTFYREIIADDPEYFKESTGKLYLHLKQSHDVDLALFSQLSLKITNLETKISFNGTNLKEYDRVLFRAITYKEINFDWMAQLAASYVVENNIKSINARHYVAYGNNWNKLRQTGLFAQNNLSVPDTYYGFDENVQFPLIAKPLHGSLGVGVHLVESSEQMLVSKEKHLFQQLLPNRQDYRIIVLGDKILGVILRRASGDNLVSNIAAGGVGAMVELDSEMERISLRLANLCKLDFCGVDLMKDAQGEYRVLEVNKNPQYNGFERITNINVSQVIEDYLIQQ